MKTLSYLKDKGRFIIAFVRRSGWIKQCECGNKCSPLRPKEILFSFGKIEIRIWNWGKMEYADKCEHCISDIENSRTEDMARANFDAGYESGYKEASRYA